MVLAQIIKQRQYDKGFKQGLEEGFVQVSRHYNATLLEWAKQRGIPADELPRFDDLSEPYEPPAQ